MKTYKEMVNEIKEEMANGGRSTFSRETFVELSKAFLNDVNNTTKVAKIKNGQIEEDEINVPDMFRKFGEKLLLDFGVDKQEAAKIRTNEYEFKNVDVMYYLCSELIYNYVSTGKKFTMVPKKDCIASFVLKEYEQEIKENVAPPKPGQPKPEPKPTLYKAHKKMKVESTCPAWLKEVIKK